MKPLKSRNKAFSRQSVPGGETDLLTSGAWSWEGREQRLLQGAEGIDGWRAWRKTYRVIKVGKDI